MSSNSHPNLFLYLAIALAAALGGTLRYGVSIAWLLWGNDGWPWPTLIVNVLGSCLIAVYWRLAGPDGRFQASPERRAVVMTGFCGGLTTFSMFGVETLVLLEQARRAEAAAYLLLTAFGAIGAAWLGMHGKRQ